MIGQPITLQSREEKACASRVSRMTSLLRYLSTLDRSGEKECFWEVKSSGVLYNHGSGYLHSWPTPWTAVPDVCPRAL